MNYVSVILPISNKNVDKTFTYSIPPHLIGKITLGMAVAVPFGKSNKYYEAYVVGFEHVTTFKTKEIGDPITGTMLLSKDMITLATWMKVKYYTTMANCIKIMMPTTFIKKPQKTSLFVSLAVLDKNSQSNKIKEDILNNKKENVKSKIISYLDQNGELEKSRLLKELNISASPILTLKKYGIVHITHKQVVRNPVNTNLQQTKAKVLNKLQSQAFKMCMDHHKNKNNLPILLHGVTGSGKTEVYMEIIWEVLKEGKEAIVLVPEISLTPQTVSRFVERFGSLVNFTHSKLSNGERRDQWQNAKEGNIAIMIGPRSAIFTPFQNLGIIIIDEEHEHTYKSETTPKYDAREVAIKRAEIIGATVIFGTATPSIQSYYNVKNSKFAYFSLTERVNQSPPQINIIDMREQLASGNMSIFSTALKEAIAHNLKNDLQTILFLNRRGYANFVSCRNCGHVMKCDNCNVNYTYHKSVEKLLCHYCNKEQENPKNCPICASKFIRGFGIGTQKVEKEIIEMFPDAKILRMDLDTTTKKHSHEIILQQFREKRANVLIGTQMIAKGLDFPNVTVVGIIAADTSLNSGDYRSGEHTFQLLTQVAGRAGRAKIPGQVFIQTYAPTHYSITYAQNGDYENFYNQEIALRRQMFYPPFSFVFVVMFSGKNEKDVIQSLFKLNNIMKHYIKKRPIFEILGPSPAIISKINNNFRWKIIIKCYSEERLRNFVLFSMSKFEQIQNLKEINISLTLNPQTIV